MLGVYTKLRMRFRILAIYCSILRRMGGRTEGRTDGRPDLGNLNPLQISEDYYGESIEC